MLISTNKQPEGRSLGSRLTADKNIISSSGRNVNPSIHSSLYSHEATNGANSEKIIRIHLSRQAKKILLRRFREFAKKHSPPWG